MTHIVSITSQGQISIPSRLRRLYGLNKFKKVLIYSAGENRLIIEPVKDLLLLKGALKSARKISAKKVRAEFEKYLATRHLK
ncbi:hypothetical protein COY29_00185 [Candidatus Woesebacteria bacterium CG_4_10_14_0_2_um_filter_39_14]|uniref:SpoVT-AbrB domain-containing protein n=3 Tax=Microgenomates group TaxID=1794810 RepID=A0A2M6YPL3_9BACT|nr:MAG: hypothetical protein COT04_01990 [Candidatus Shapirobacteria bacterium CG07_land_8_20_14_0_80_39_12]PIZ50264.1 MAG: hypothetical protein COY29_00185 [Candidatus Woesebacteria bacterium CG_4_10_14_0_2_um_filter_39_14]PJA50067.1 MAG: hypothetical protein CO169_00165 [Candidatus Shapirobacteria bacterium CG_4_9_14_3_um_filter_39_13]